MNYQEIENFISSEAARATAIVKAIESLQHYATYKSLVDVEEAVKALQAILDSAQKQQSTDPAGVSQPTNAESQPTKAMTTEAPKE